MEIKHSLVVGKYSEFVKIEFRLEGHEDKFKTITLGGLLTILNHIGSFDLMALDPRDNDFIQYLMLHNLAYFDNKIGKWKITLDKK